MSIGSQQVISGPAEPADKGTLAWKESFVFRNIKTRGMDVVLWDKDLHDELGSACIDLVDAVAWPAREPTEGWYELHDMRRVDAAGAFVAAGYVMLRCRVLAVAENLQAGRARSGTRAAVEDEGAPLETPQYVSIELGGATPPLKVGYWTVGLGNCEFTVAATAVKHTAFIFEISVARPALHIARWHRTLSADHSVGHRTVYLNSVIDKGQIELPLGDGSMCLSAASMSLEAVPRQLEDATHLRVKVTGAHGIPSSASAAHIQLRAGECPPAKVGALEAGTGAVAGGVVLLPWSGWMEVELWATFEDNDDQDGCLGRAKVDFADPQGQPRRMLTSGGDLAVAFEQMGSVNVSVALVGFVSE